MNQSQRQTIGSLRKPTTAATLKGSQISKITSPVNRRKLDYNQSSCKPTQSLYFSNENFTIFQDIQEIHCNIDKGEIKIDNTVISKTERN